MSFIEQKKRYVLFESAVWVEELNPSTDLSAVLSIFSDGSLRVSSLECHPKGHLIASGNADSTIKIWDATTGEVICTFDGDPRTDEARATENLQLLVGLYSPVVCLAWSPDGRYLASAGEGDKAVKLWDVVIGEIVTTFYGHQSKVTCLSWSPDSKQLASGSDDATIKIWSIESERAILTFKKHKTQIEAVSWHPIDATLIASTSESNFSLIWNASTQEVFHTFENNHLSTSQATTGVNQIAWHPIERNLLAFHEKSATTEQEGKDKKKSNIKIWNLEKKEIIKEFESFPSPLPFLPLRLCWSADGQRIVANSFNQIVVWNDVFGKIDCRVYSEEAKHISLYPDGNRIACIDTQSKLIKILDISTVTITPNASPMTTTATERVKKHCEDIYSLAWSPDGRSIATVSKRNSVIVWNATTHQPIHVLECYAYDWKEGCSVICWSREGRHLAVIGHHSIVIYDTSTGKVVKQLVEVFDVTNIAWTEFPAQGGGGTKSMIATTTSDRNVNDINLWDPWKTVSLVNCLCSLVGPVAHLKTLQGHEKAVLSLAWSTDGSRLASGSEDQTVKIWDGFTGKLLKTLTLDFHVLIWDVMSGQLIKKLQQTHDYYDLVPVTIDWIENDRYVAIGTRNHEIQLWHVKTGRMVRKLEGYKQSLITVAWRPGDRSQQCLASNGKDMMIKVWTAIEF